MSNTAFIKTDTRFGYFREAKYHVEDQFKSDNPNILGRVWVVASKCDEATFNNTVYSRDLWVTLFKSKDFVDRMKRKLILGNLDHPEKPKQKAKDATHTAIEVDIRGSEVWVKFEILNTPDGRILWTLLGAGVVLGVSSRSTGTDEERGGKIYLQSDTFKLMGWDFVVDESAFGSMFKEFTEDKRDAILKVVNEEKGNDSFLATMVESTAKADGVQRVAFLEDCLVKSRAAVDQVREESRAFAEEKVRLEERIAATDAELQTTKKEKVRLESIVADRDKVIALKEEGQQKYREEIKGITARQSHLEEKLVEKDKTIEEMRGVIQELGKRKAVSIQVLKNFSEEKEEENLVARTLAKTRGKQK